MLQTDDAKFRKFARKFLDSQVAKAAVGRLSGCTCVHSHQWYTQSHIKYHPAAGISFSNLVKMLSIRWRFSRHPQYCPMPHGFWVRDSRHPQLVCHSLWSPQDSFHFKTLIHLLTTIIPTYTSSFFFQFSHFQESSSFVSSIS